MSTKSNQTIQQKTEALNDLVAWFDSDEFELEKALEKFKEAETLATEIERDLLELKNEVTVLKQKFDESA
ncbi:MAG TPA: hypothetical protein VFZ62_03340 [Candidatus Saccharimonadales bacterium]